MIRAPRDASYARWNEFRKIDRRESREETRAGEPRKRRKLDDSKDAIVERVNMIVTTRPCPKPEQM